MNKKIKTVGIAALAAAVAGGLAALLIRDQMTRHQRDLFNPLTFRRLAALGHMARERATVNGVTLLRDFIAWEPRKLLQTRAQAIVDRMERELGEGDSGLRTETA